MRYVGGYIVKKFPQYSFLGGNISTADSTWLGEISRILEGFKTLSNEFWSDLKEIEKIFGCFHGKTEIIPGKDAIKTLSRKILDFVKLPQEVAESL